MRIRIGICIVLFVGFLAAVAIQTALRMVLPHLALPEPHLQGVFKEVAKPQLTLGSWWNGEFQRRVQGTERSEGWIDRHVGFRSVWVKTDNQINFSLFRQIPTTTNPQQIVLGKDNWIYEIDYVNDYLGLETAPERVFENLASDLRELQERLQAQHVAFLLVISPSKTAHYPEYLPDWLVCERETLRQHDGDQRSNYDRLMRWIKREGVHCVDAAELFRREKMAHPEYRLFTRGGTHWSQYGASLVVTEILARLREQTGRDLRQLECRSVSVDSVTRGTDNDLGDVLNLWTPWATKGPTAHPQIAVTGGRWKPNVLWVGNSFSDTLVGLMDRYKVYRRRDSLFVFRQRTVYPDPQQRRYPIDRATFDWQQELLARDVVVIEMNEAQLADLAYGFLRGALAFFRNQAAP